jgi:phosphoglycerate dehydrogenase-like enzyme
MKRAAILDDYQHVALSLADWKSLAPDVQVETIHEHIADEDKLAARLKDFEILVIMRERTAFPRSLLEKLPKLELLVSTGPRNRSVDVKFAKERGIVVCGTHSLGNPTAELCIGLIIAVMRNIPAEDRATRLGAWQHFPPGPGLQGKTLGLIGLGRQGGGVAKLAQAFDMKLLAWSQNLKKERCDEFGAELAPSLDDLLKRSDVITIHLLLSDRTRNLIGAREFGLMKKTAYFINTSRGPIVNEAALIDTLERKAIAGAALDVFDIEPLPLDHKLRRLDNTVIAPHLGYGSLDNFDQMYRTAVDNIKAWLAGTPKNVMAD